MYLAFSQQEPETEVFLETILAWDEVLESVPEVALDASYRAAVSSHEGDYGLKATDLLRAYRSIQAGARPTKRGEFDAASFGPRPGDMSPDEFRAEVAKLIPKPAGASSGMTPLRLIRPQIGDDAGLATKCSACGAEFWGRECGRCAARTMAEEETA